MSLVAYGSSGESSEEEQEASEITNDVASLIKQTRTSLSLPAPKDAEDNIPNPQPCSENNEIKPSIHSSSTTNDESTLFKNLPKPKHIEIDPADEIEDEIIIPPEKNSKISREKGAKRSRAPVKIALPSLSEFKDVDEEQEKSRKNRIKPSQNGTGLFSILPPPKGLLTKATTRTLIPDAVKRLPPTSRSVPQKQFDIVPVKTANPINNSNILAAKNYDSDSDEESSGVGEAEKKIGGKVDFFSLESSSVNQTPSMNDSGADFFSLSSESQISSVQSATRDDTIEMYQRKRNENVSEDLPIANQIYESSVVEFSEPSRCVNEGRGAQIFDKTLTSNVINLPKEQIIMKNKAEVGPKLPVPEQEYNVDSHGNVAFDEKAIEYLCGKRGVKRKNKDFDEANIIEINGEDIKPDEREWLVKALTEEAAERPVSMESAGPSTQSRKKHQITYLAHQAKAMEVELKNQWAQNKVTRKQTQSKYGF